MSMTVWRVCEVKRWWVGGCGMPASCRSSFASSHDYSVVAWRRRPAVSVQWSLVVSHLQRLTNDIGRNHCHHSTGRYRRKWRTIHAGPGTICMRRRAAVVYMIVAGDYSSTFSTYHYVNPLQQRCTSNSLTDPALYSRYTHQSAQHVGTLTLPDTTHRA